MSLVKQLWLAVSGLMILVFVSSFTISSLSAKSYYQEQLSLKNNDNASSLALVLSQMDKDPVTVELLVSAQFDTGNYKRISLIDPNGEMRVSKKYESEMIEKPYPEWFAGLVSLNVHEGVAQVQNGWQQYGVLYVESDDRFAYQALWKTTWQFFVWFLVATIILGVLGTWVLRVLTRPLDDVVEQAEAIQSRRFVTSEVPRTLEFKKVVKAMNSMTQRVKEMLDKESRRLEVLRFKTQHDELTGLANRQYFMNQFDALLNNHEQEGRHVLLILRFDDLSKINQQLGHQPTDKLLKEFTGHLQSITEEFSSNFSEAYLARLNGRDFTALLANFTNINDFLKTLEKRLEVFANQHPELESLHLPAAALQFPHSEGRGRILQQIDSLLAESELQRSYEIVFREMEAVQETAQAPDNVQGWRELLETVINLNSVQPQFYPVNDCDNNLIHHEAMMRIQVNGKTHAASFFLPWAKRLGLLPLFDLLLVKNVVEKLQVESQKGEVSEVAINLSVESLQNFEIREQIVETLRSAIEVCPKIWIEVPEKSVLEAVNQFIDFSKTVKGLGCQVGIDRAGASFSSLPSLQEIGLDYLKLDAALTQNLQNQDAQTNGFVRSLCGLGHSIGLKVIAEGVREEAMIAELPYLGFDGVTGPAVK
ncbi:EAL domain-containing protein [Thiomicrorhabdus indica]|uniref:bifunctional diguanylate cyclase/phosphodiesterase n=1 Tax=Thiomicrorhabdus indica TaxID=2267253 RepID=UPI002AA7A2CD|nr:EAL domain-containing protein [Thiomicrorhabdus indica]